MTPLEIRRLRHRLGWTQTRLADYLGVSQSLVSAWEAGTRAPSQPVSRLLEPLAALGADAPTLTDRRDLIGALLDTLHDALSRDLDDRASVKSLQRFAHPGPAAYVDQGFGSVEGLLPPHVQRDTLLAALLEGPEVSESIRARFDSLRARVDAPELDPLPRLLMLASDAVWLLELLGWRSFDPPERDALHRAALTLLRDADDEPSR